MNRAVSMPSKVFHLTLSVQHVKDVALFFRLIFAKVPPS